MDSTWNKILIQEFTNHKNYYSCIVYLVFDFCSDNISFIISHILSLSFFVISIYISCSVIQSIFQINNKTIKYYVYFWLFSGFSFFLEFLSSFIPHEYYDYLRSFLELSPSFFRGMAQMIFCYIILKFYKDVTNTQPILGNILILISSFVLILIAIVSIAFDFSRIIYKIDKKNVSSLEHFVQIIETFTQLTSLYCFIKTFFISREVPLYLNPKSLFVLRSVTVSYEVFSIFYFSLNLYSLDYDFYVHVHVHKPHLIKLIEHLTVFTYYFINIIRMLVTSISVIILNLNIMDKSKNNEDQLSIKEEYKLSLIDY